MNRSFHLPLFVAGAMILTLLLAAACYPLTSTPAVPAAVPAGAATSTTAAVAPAAASPPSNSITGIVWQWTSVTNQTTKQTTTVPDPASYTIVFNADGTLAGKADCNSFAGIYSQQNGFTIKLGPSTMVACGPGSLDQQYLQLLSSVAAGGPDGQGNMALETAGGEQRMLFKNGGPATVAPAATQASGNPITGIVWQWASVTNQSTRQTTTVPDPASYTITFNPDGTVTGKADCNTFSGTYSQQNGFAIHVVPNVMAACGTLDSQYITLLNQVAAGGPDGQGNLALETAGGEQRMLFKNGGAAPN